MLHYRCRPGVRRGVPRGAGLDGIGLGPVLFLVLIALPRSRYHPFRRCRRAGRGCRRLRGTATAAVAAAATTAAGAVTTTDSVAAGALDPGKQGGKIESRHFLIVGGPLADRYRVLSILGPRGVGGTASGGGCDSASGREGAPPVRIVLVVSAWLSKGRCTFSKTLNKHNAKSRIFSSSGAPTKGGSCGKG